MFDRYSLLVVGILAGYALVRLYIVFPQNRKAYLQASSILGFIISGVIFDSYPQLNIIAYLIGAISMAIMVLSFATDIPDTVRRIFKIAELNSEIDKAPKLIDVWIAGVLSILILLFIAIRA